MVERTNGWVNHCRRIDRHYETTLAAHEGFLYLSQIACYAADSTAVVLLGDLDAFVAEIDFDAELAVEGRFTVPVARTFISARRLVGTVVRIAESC